MPERPLARPHRPRDTASRHLAAIDPEWAALIGRVGPCRLRPDRTVAPFEALVRAIAHQQVHARAAEAILGRMLAHFAADAFPPPSAILALDDAAMRACGFSGSKTAAIRDIARGAEAGIVPTRAAAARLPDARLIERLSDAARGGTVDGGDAADLHAGATRHPAGRRFRRARGLSQAPRAGGAAGPRRRWRCWGCRGRRNRSTAAWYLWRASEEGRAARASAVTG